VGRGAGLGRAEKKEKFPGEVGGPSLPGDFTKKELGLWAATGNHHPARVPASPQGSGLGRGRPGLEGQEASQRSANRSAGSPIPHRALIVD
jgi:hypothetical protein